MTKNIKVITLFLIIYLLASCNYQKKSNDKTRWIISAPAGSEFTKIDKLEKTVIPNGRYITPAGKSIVTAPHPYGLTLSPDGNIAITANSGTNPLSITIVRNILTKNPEIQQNTPPVHLLTKRGYLASVFMGLAISPNNQTVYVAGRAKRIRYICSILTQEKKQTLLIVLM